MADLYQFLRNVQVVVFVAVAVIAILQWRRHRTPSSRWLAATFGVLGVVVVVGRLLPVHSEDPAVQWARHVLITVLVLFPYFLYRFTTSFVRPIAWVFHSAWILTAAVALIPYALGRIPEQGEPRTPEFQAYIVLLLLHWMLLTWRSAYLLWRGASHEPASARKRMRTLALGAIGLALALLVAGSAPTGDEVRPPQIVTQLLALVSAPLFILGFAPPGLVRAAWRRPEELALHETERSLLAVKDAKGVADAVLPYAARLVGGRSARLEDNNGNLIGAYEVPARPGGVQPVVTRADESTDLVVKLERGTLRVHPSPFSPFFGREEHDILETLAILSDLALARADLLEQLERSNRDLEQFAYVASHDLQEPLRTVASYAELLAQRNRESLDEKSQRHIDYIVDGCTRMQTLINDLLRFSRVGTKGEALKTVDPNESIGRALEALQVAIEKTNASVEVGDLPAVDADPLQLTQLFQNLISNAIKYRGDARPEVTISAEAADSRVTFAVKDNGIGIDPKYFDRIFTIFQRLHTRQEYSGTGIGLAICKKIVERHGGAIWVESDGQSGSTFFFTLPVPSKP